MNTPNTDETGVASTSWVRDNDWVQAAATGKRPTPWWMALIVGTVFAFVFVGLPNGVDLDDGADEVSFKQQAFNLGVGGGLLILAVFAWVRFKEGRPIRTIGFMGPKPLVRFFSGLVIGAVLFSVAVLAMVALGGIERVDVDSGSVGSSAIGVVLLLGLGWFLQATSEEVAFRGLMFPPAALQLPVVVAFLAPAVVFAFLHAAGEGSGPLPLINVLIFALAATAIALADRGLLLIMGIHTGWNWFQGNVFGIPVSGMDLNENAIVRLAPVDGEPRILSGGGFGMEATIATTVIWIVVFAIAIAVARRRAHDTASAVHADPA